MRWRPRESRSRSRPGSVPAEGGSLGPAHSLGAAQLATALGILLTSITIKQAPSCNAILLPNLLVDPVDEYIQSSFRKTQTVKKSLGPVPAARASDTRLPSGPRSHCCRGAGLPAGMGKFSLLLPECALTARAPQTAFVRTPAGLDGRLTCHQRTPRGQVSVALAQMPTGEQRGRAGGGRLPSTAEVPARRPTPSGTSAPRPGPCDSDAESVVTVI